MGKISFIKKLYNYLGGLQKILLVIALSIMLFNVTLGVFYRYVLNNSLSWTEEVARYLMIWFGFIGMGVAMKDERHVGITVIRDLFSEKVTLYLKIISNILIMIFLIYIFRASVKHMSILKFQTSPAVGINMRWPYFSVTFGSVLMMIENLKQFIDNILGLKNIKQTTNE